MSQPEIEVTYWKGQARYHCPLKWESGAACTWDTYDPQLLSAHMAQPHTRDGKAKGGQAQVVSPLLDHNGKAIVHERVQASEVTADFKGFKFKEG